MTQHACGKRALLGFLWTISVVTYLNAVNITVAGNPVAVEFGLSSVELGMIFSMFVLGYTLFQIPGGWLGDRFGHQRVLTFALVWGSVFTALTAWAVNSFLVPILGVFPIFWIVRFLVGVGQSATYPCAFGLVERAFAKDEAGRAMGLILSGVGLGAAVTPPFITLLTVSVGWRTAFYICAAIGMVLALSFHLCVSRDSTAKVSHNSLSLVRGGIPDQAVAISKSPAAKKTNGTPWKQILGNPQIWNMTLGNFLLGYVVWVYFSWFYLYLVNVLRFSALRASGLSTLPFLAMAIGAPLGGWLGHLLTPQVGRIRSRRYIATGGLVGGGVSIAFGAGTPNPYIAVAFLSVAAGLLYLAPSSYWATVGEIFPGHAATASGIMNTGGSLGACLAPTLTPWIAGHYGWVAALYAAAALSIVAAAGWMFIGPAGSKRR